MTDSDVFHCISHPIRREIMELLSHQEMSIASIKRHIDGENTLKNNGEIEQKSRTAINKHLNTLLKARLVEKQSIGRETIFQLRIAPLSDVKEWLAYFDKYWDEKLESLKKFVESDK